MSHSVRVLQGLVALVAIVSLNAGAAMFTPGQPCNGCELEIFDHGGVMPTAKNAVFRVQNPQTPNGPAPFIELYNPTLAVIQDCAQKVQGVQGNPGSVKMMASEYRLAGSNQVVFLVKDCQMMPGPGPGGMRVVPGNKIDPKRGPAQFEPGRVMDGGMMHDGPHDGAMDRDGGDSMGGDGCPTYGDVPSDTSCAVSGGGLQTVGNPLSESCQLSYDDVSGSAGRQMVIYDNGYSVACVGGIHQAGIYVGTTPSNSNWGAYVPSGSTCQMKTGVRPSDGARVVEKIVCP